MMLPMSLPWRTLVVAAVVATFVGCSVDGRRSGTGVGNPGSAKTVLSRVAGVTLTGGEVTVKALVAERCDGTFAETDVSRTVDLALGETLELGGGDLCAVELQLQPPLAVRGTVDTGEALSLDIPLSTVRVAPSSALRVDGEGFVFELGNGTWFDPGAPADVATIAAALGDTSALYRDDDDDGEVDDEERESGPVAEAEDDEDDDDSSNDDPTSTDDDDDGDDDNGTGTGDQAESNEEVTDGTDDDGTDGDDDGTDGDDDSGDDTGDDTGLP